MVRSMSNSRNRLNYSQVKFCSKQKWTHSDLLTKWLPSLRWSQAGLSPQRDSQTPPWTSFPWSWSYSAFVCSLIRKQWPHAELPCSCLVFYNCQIEFHQIHSKENPWAPTSYRFQAPSMSNAELYFLVSPVMFRVKVTDEVTYFVLLMGKILVSGIVGEYC